MSGAPEVKERFAMCMAEAGYPILPRQWSDDAKTVGYTERALGASFWRACYRAHLLTDPSLVRQLAMCEDCYVIQSMRMMAEWKSNGGLPKRRSVGCTHEVAA